MGNVIWAAGTKASPLLNTLGVDQDPRGRVKVQPDLTISGDPWIFVIGDAAHCLDRDGIPLPEIASVARSEGRYVARLINEELSPAHRVPVSYQDRGMLVTIGRSNAVAQIGPLRTSGLIAWSLWCVVHILFLIGLRKRVRVISEWAWYYLTVEPGARLLFTQAAVGHNTLSSDQTGDVPREDRNVLRCAT